MKYEITEDKDGSWYVVCKNKDGQVGIIVNCQTWDMVLSFMTMQQATLGVAS